MGAIAKTTSLNMFLKEINNYPLLNNEEEHDLAVQY